MAKCIKCKSSQIRKHGFGRNEAQRFFCRGCHSSFTLKGVRGTYAPEFKESVVDSYCHQKHKAQEVIKKFWISTRTLIKRKKAHQADCHCGKHELRS